MKNHKTHHQNKRLFSLLALVLLLTLCFSIVAEAAASRNKFKLSDEERKFVNSLDTVTVAVSPDSFPYSYIENGKYVGIIPEIIELMAYKTDIDFEIIPCNTYQDYSNLKKAQEADVVFATHVSTYDALKAGYRKTESYLTIPYSKLEYKKNSISTGKVATLKDPSPELEVAERYYYADTILQCESQQECMDALRQHRSDATIVNSFAAQNILYQDVRNQYVVKQIHENEVSIAAGVKIGKDEKLYTILNRALITMDGTTLQEIVNRNTQIIDTDNDTVNLIYSKPELVMAIFGVISLLILIAAFLFVRMKQADTQRNSAEEFKRFLGYICTAYDSVAEVNLKTRLVKRFVAEDGVVKEEEDFNSNIDELFYVPAEDRELIRSRFSSALIKEIIEKGEAQYFECRLKWSQRALDYRWHSCTLQGIVPTREKPYSFLLMVKDIDELKKNEEIQKKNLTDALEQAKQASQAKGQFLSRMSHEIRTPLNAVIGYMTIAREDKDDPVKVQHCVENSDIAAKHLLSIINDVLDISSIESGKMKIAMTDFDMKNMLSEITTVFYQQARTKEVKFEVALQGVTEEWVVGDSMRVKQVLMNLLSNAVKFTSPGGIVRLVVNQKPAETEANKVYYSFEIVDTGIGMTKEYMNRLFQPFEQQDATTAQKYGGTGLGLSITKNLVNMMGGNIQMKSEEGKGSAFKVTLFFGRSDKNKSSVSIRDYSSVRVLIVDDVDDECSYMKSLLKRCKVKSDSVNSGQAAIKQLRRRAGSDYAYDMCIIDWNMPDMNGVETAKTIREAFGNDLPIIIATAYDTSDVENTAFEAGVNRVIAKPLFQSTMFDLLVQNFGKYEPQSEDAESIVSLKGLKALLVEDNEMNMEIGSDVLRRLGVEVDKATDGKQAVDTFLAKPEGSYDLILMDIQMPVMNGYEATRAIRSSDHPEARTIPIIAMTANAFDSDVAEALSNGMNDHISKPIDRDKLIRAIKKVTQAKDEKSEQ